MERRWNIDHQPVVITHDKPAIRPGEAHEFTREEVEAGVTGSWADEDPRKGLGAEREFKETRDRKKRSPMRSGDDDPVVPVVPDSDPATPEEE